MAEELRTRIRVPGDTRLAAFLAPIQPRDRAAAILALAEVAVGQGDGPRITDLADAVRALAAALKQTGGCAPAAGTAPANTPPPTSTPTPPDPGAPVSPEAAARAAKFAAAGGWG